MPEDFVPATSMERAYLQARVWPAERAWRRAGHCVSEGQLPPGIGMYLCLLDYYARRDGIKELFDTCQWVLARLRDLNPDERLSVCKIVCHIAKSLTEDEFDLHEARLKLILRLPLAVILEAVAEQRLSCALTGLLEFSRVFDESVSLKRLSELDGDFMGVALSIDRAIRAGRVRDKIRTSECMTREQYDKERLEAIAMAEQIKEKLANPEKNIPPAQQSSEPQTLPWPDSEPLSTPDAQIPPLPDSTLPLLGPKELPTLKVETTLPSKFDYGLSSMVGMYQNILGKDKLSKAERDFEQAMREFGPRSSQVAHTLANLIGVAHELVPDAPLDDQICQLNEIVADETVNISPYLLRKILSSIGKADERQHLLAVLASIEKSILSRREQLVGLDVSLAIALWRLIGLWHGATTLFEGHAYCERLHQRLSNERDANDPVVRQVSSAIAFISRIHTGEIRLDTAATSVRGATDESAEFAAMLSVMALDETSRGETAKAKVILDELIWFYSDAVSDSNRRVGEMLWLLQETALRQFKQYTVFLVFQAQRVASDEYLKARLYSHVKRLFELIDDEDQMMDVLSNMIAAKKEGSESDSPQEIKRLLMLARSESGFERESGEERKRANSSMIWKSRPQKILHDLEKCAQRKDWKKFASIFNKEKDVLSVDEGFYRLVELGLKAASDFQILQSEKIVDLLLLHTSPSCAHALDVLAEKVKQLLVDSDNSYEAADLLKRVLSNEHQPIALKNRLRLQLADIYVSMGNTFEATVLIYQAFAEIPEAEYGGSEPPLLTT